MTGSKDILTCPALFLPRLASSEMGVGTMRLRGFGGPSAATTVTLLNEQALGPEHSLES